MTIQSQFNDEALALLPMTKKYLEESPRPDHDRYVIVARINRGRISLIDMSADDLHIYDINESLRLRFRNEISPDEYIAIKITKQEIFDDDAALIAIFPPGCNYEVEKGVEGYQVDFDISYDLKEYRIAFQNECREDGMKAHNPAGMTPAIFYGYDADQSRDFLEDHEESDESLSILSELEKIAGALCQKWLDNELSEFGDVCQKWQDGELHEFGDIGEG